MCRGGDHVPRIVLTAQNRLTDIPLRPLPVDHAPHGAGGIFVAQFGDGGLRGNQRGFDVVDEYRFVIHADRSPLLVLLSG